MLDQWTVVIEQINAEVAWFQRRALQGETTQSWTADGPWPKAAIPTLWGAPEDVQDAVLRFGAVLALMKLAIRSHLYSPDAPDSVCQFDLDLSMRAEEIAPLLDLPDPCPHRATRRGSKRCRSGPRAEPMW